MPSIETPNDAALVAACLAGNKSAYGDIVTRYQRLLCSLAYSAMGSVSDSEDVAQEAFIEGWQKLRALRDPEKLRPWLCGILRHKVSRRRRRGSREPTQGAHSLDEISELESTDESIDGVAMRAEEQTLMWQALERVPTLYREPLILYYREHRSVEHVACDLDLTEDTVKQRLSRGRKLLQEQMMSFVEDALARSTPGRVFTIGVLASLPAFVPSAKAVGIGAVATHGGVMAKSTGIAAMLASVTGIVNFVLTMRAVLDQARTPHERRVVVKAVVASFLASLGFLFLVYMLRWGAFRWWEYRAAFAVTSQALLVAALIVWPVAIVRMMRHFRRLRSRERRLHPEWFTDPRDQVGSDAGEYRSRLKLLGVPLAHFRFSLPDEGAPPVFGWIAGGDRAFGLLFAWGTCAVAPISVGVVSVGLLSVGALGVGVIGLGTFGVGLLAVGCVSVGVKAYGWLSALGWETARSSGFGIARVAAEAPVAFAEHANDPVALETLTDPRAEQNQMIFFIVIVLFSLVPLVYYTREVRRRMGGGIGRESK